MVGGGIGGLAVGRLLRDADFEVEILERASHLVPGGAGISLWPNATRVLRSMGVGELLPRPRSFPGSGLHRWDGRLLLPTDIGEVEQRYGAPMLFLRRTTLHGALLSGGVEELVRTGVEVVEVEETRSEVRATTRDGESFRGDFLIGADGVNSRVRQALLGDGPPTPRGIVAFRALIDPPPLELGMGEYWGPGRVFGLVPVDGGKLFWLATRRGNPAEVPEPDPIPGLLERHRGWAPEIPTVIEATPSEEILQHALVDRKPTRRWARGRIALLGDAVHPMLPFLGQGACQALEDAEALAGQLRASTDVQAALLAYQERRRKRAARLVGDSRRVGRLAHLRAAPLRAVRDRAVAMTPERLRNRQIDAVVGAS